ncbi:MAG: hypothetical protein ACLTYW_09225 [Collinsella sp.]
MVNLVHEERYCRADAATMDAQVAEMDAMFRPHAREVGSASWISTPASTRAPLWPR